MSYLIKKSPNSIFGILYQNDSLILKTYSSKYSRPISLARNMTPVYSAALDTNNGINIVFKSKDNKIIHLKENNLNYLRNIILDDQNNTYNISNMRLISCNDNLYLFYTALNPYENTNDLIFHNITNSTSPPQSIVSLTNINSSYDIISLNGKLYLVCYNKSTQYELNLFSFDLQNNNWTLEKTLHTQTNPITYTSFCHDCHNNLHIVYISENFGSYQLYYINNSQTQQKLIHSSAYSIEPIIFQYKEYIWINWIENNVNKMTFSDIDNANFSSISKASFQLDYMDIVYLINPYDEICGQKFYGSIIQNPIISVLSQIDLDNMLLNNNLNTELNLLIKNVNKKSNYNNTEDEPENDLNSEINYLKQVQHSIKQQYDDLAKLAKNLQEEGKHWKSKYLKSEMEVKKLKDELKVLSVSKTNNQLNQTKTINSSSEQMKQEIINNNEQNIQDTNSNNIV